MVKQYAHSCFIAYLRCVPLRNPRGSSNAHLIILALPLCGVYSKKRARAQRLQSIAMVNKTYERIIYSLPTLRVVNAIEFKIIIRIPGTH